MPAGAEKQIQKILSLIKNEKIELEDFKSFLESQNLQIFNLKEFLKQLQEIEWLLTGDHYLELLVFLLDKKLLHNNSELLVKFFKRSDQQRLTPAKKLNVLFEPKTLSALSLEQQKKFARVCHVEAFKSFLVLPNSPEIFAQYQAIITGSNEAKLSSLDFSGYYTHPVRSILRTCVNKHLEQELGRTRLGNDWFTVCKNYIKSFFTRVANVVSTFAQARYKKGVHYVVTPSKKGELDANQNFAEYSQKPYFVEAIAGSWWDYVAISADFYPVKNININIIFARFIEIQQRLKTLETSLTKAEDKNPSAENKISKFKKGKLQAEQAQLQKEQYEIFNQFKITHGELSSLHWHYLGVPQILQLIFSDKISNFAFKKQLINLLNQKMEDVLLFLDKNPAQVNYVAKIWSLDFTKPTPTGSAQALPRLGEISAQCWEQLNPRVILQLTQVSGRAKPILVAKIRQEIMGGNLKLLQNLLESMPEQADLNDSICEAVFNILAQDDIKVEQIANASKDPFVIVSTFIRENPQHLLIPNLNALIEVPNEENLLKGTSLIAHDKLGKVIQRIPEQKDNAFQKLKNAIEFRIAHADKLTEKQLLHVFLILIHLPTDLKESVKTVIREKLIKETDFKIYELLLLLLPKSKGNNVLSELLNDLLGAKSFKDNLALHLRYISQGTPIEKDNFVELLRSQIKSENLQDLLQLFPDVQRENEVVIKVRELLFNVLLKEPDKFDDLHKVFNECKNDIAHKKLADNIAKNFDNTLKLNYDAIKKTLYLMGLLVDHPSLITPLIEKIRARLIKENDTEALSLLIQLLDNKDMRGPHKEIILRILINPVNAKNAEEKGIVQHTHKYIDTLSFIENIQIFELFGQLKPYKDNSRVLKKGYGFLEEKIQGYCNSSAPVDINKAIILVAYLRKAYKNPDFFSNKPNIKTGFEKLNKGALKNCSDIDTCSPEQIVDALILMNYLPDDLKNRSIQKIRHMMCDSPSTQILENLIKVMTKSQNPVVCNTIFEIVVGPLSLQKNDKTIGQSSSQWKKLQKNNFPQSVKLLTRFKPLTQNFQNLETLNKFLLVLNAHFQKILGNLKAYSDKCQKDFRELSKSYLAMHNYVSTMLLKMSSELTQQPTDAVHKSLVSQPAVDEQKRNTGKQTPSEQPIAKTQPASLVV